MQTKTDMTKGGLYNVKKRSEIQCFQHRKESNSTKLSSGELPSISCCNYLNIKLENRSNHVHCALL